MKILELRFKNINSLYGEWRIDFTDPNFVTDGLFAITGPTGSGKTTILDAICLALYGETPRLGKMTASENEVMSRQTGECFAEVMFQAASGSFRASWHQHRSRKKAGAPLQSPKREVAKADGMILAEKLKDVQAQIDQITGMNFDRFTRSVLLAQGSFDTFLKASADDRSPILEQITGTEIYTEISKAVHQRNSTENQALNELKAGLGGIQLLSEEDLEQIDLNLKQMEETHRFEAKKRDAAKAALDWNTRIETLENAIKINRAEQEAWRIETEIFQPEADRLSAARRARPLDIDHAKLVNLRNHRLKIETELTASIEITPTLEQQHTETTHALTASALQLKEKAHAQQKLAPILKQVRSLDTTIAERFASLEKEATNLTKLQDEFNALQTKENENQSTWMLRQAELNEAETYQQAHAQDAELVGQLAAIFQTLEQLKKLETDQTKASTAAEQAATTARDSAATARSASGNLTVVQEQFIQAETALKAITANLDTARTGQSLADWQTRLNELQLRVKLEKQRSKNRTAWIASTAEVQTTANERAEKVREQTGLEREQKLLLQNLQLRHKIESLDVERSELVNGRPCPLCGALEHPYATVLPAPETESIDRVHADLSALAAQINILTGKQSAAETRCQTLQESMEHAEAELQNLAEGTAEEAKEIAGRIEQIKQLEQKQNDTKAALDVARETLSQHRLAEQTANQTATADAEKSKTAEILKKETSTLFEDAQSALFQTLEPYGMESMAGAADQLKKRRDQWLVAEKKQTDLKQAIAQLQTTLSDQGEQIKGLTLRKEMHAEASEKGRIALKQLIADRREQFGDRLPDAVEQEAQSALDSARKGNETAQNNLHQITQGLSLAREKIQTLEKNKQEIEKELTDNEPLFFQSLQTAHFEDEAAYLAARLPESDQAELEKRADELKQRHTRLSALKAEKMKQLQAEREQKHIKSSPEEHAVLIESCIELQQQIGGFKDRIKANEKAKALHRDKLDEITKQQAEYSRWNQLHELIGSADGKKFRNFAQGLTFELMVSQANRQLAKMSDRYLLIRDVDKPLDLNVIDNYQAGEIRPVKNLSGGESFIVSLSLALGLSKMASKTIRVDSLFLDEGFGTLDEDALETALEALSELKQDGKIIGVISHVSAMKERIGTQINVHATSGGRSHLSGAGISRP